MSDKRQEHKITKEKANYRQGEGQRKCGNCLFFQENENACTRVFGTIKAHMLCDLFQSEFQEEPVTMSQARQFLEGKIDVDEFLNESVGPFRPGTGQPDIVNLKPNSTARDVLNRLEKHANQMKFAEDEDQKFEISKKIQGLLQVMLSNFRIFKDWMDLIKNKISILISSAGEYDKAANKVLSMVEEIRSELSDQLLDRQMLMRS